MERIIYKFAIPIIAVSAGIAHTLNDVYVTYVTLLCIAIVYVCNIRVILSNENLNDNYLLNISCVTIALSIFYNTINIIDSKLLLLIFLLQVLIIYSLSLFKQINKIKSIEIKNITTFSNKKLNKLKINTIHINELIFTYFLSLMLILEINIIYMLMILAIEIIYYSYLFLRSMRYVYKTQIAVYRALSKVGPNFIVPYAGKAAFHVPMWEPLLAKLNKPFIIYTVQRDTLSLIAEKTKMPVVLIETPSKQLLSRIIPKTVKSAFYTHNSKLNKHFFVRKNIKNIFLHHGDSDKPACYNKRSNIYDKLFVAGQAAIDRYANHGVLIPKDKFVIIGRPQLANIHVVNYKKYLGSGSFVLYAPTWLSLKESNNFSSLEIGLDIVKCLEKLNVNIIFRPHPHSLQRKNDKNYIKEIINFLESNNNKNHIFGNLANESLLVDMINKSDALIADVSGVVTDYMQSGKPYAMVSRSLGAKEFREKYPSSKSAYVIDQKNDMDKVLELMLHDDPIANSRWARMKYYLGEMSGIEVEERFLSECLKTID